MSAHLLALPNELLLEIAEHLPRLPRDRRAELVSLTIVCKGLYDIATKLLHKDVCIDIARVHSLVSLYVAQPKLAQLVRSIDLFRTVETYDERINKVENLGIYIPIIRSSGIKRPLQRTLEDDLRIQNQQAHIALLLLQVPHLQDLLLGKISCKHIPFFDPVFINGSAFIEMPDYGNRDACRPYLREIIARRLKSRLKRLEIPSSGLCNSISKHQILDLSDYTQLTHVTTSVDELMAPTWESWGSEPVYNFAALPKTLTHLIFRGMGWDLGRLLAHLNLEKVNGSLPKLRSLVIYTKQLPDAIAEVDRQNRLDHVQSEKTAAHVHTLEDVGITVTLRYGDTNRHSYCLGLDLLRTGYRSRYMTARLKSLEM